MYKDFTVMLTVSAPDNYDESDVENTFYDLFRGPLVMMDLGTVQATED